MDGELVAYLAISADIAEYADMSKDDTASILVRMPKELLAQIDAVRGEVPRTVYIRRVLRQEMARAIASPRVLDIPPDRPLSAPKPGGVRLAQESSGDHASLSVQLGPTKPALGSRLKKEKP